VYKISSFDIATKLGWATWESGRISSGVYDFKNGAWDGAGICYLKFARWLRRYHADSGLVSFEGVMSHGPGGIYAAHKYGGFVAVLQAECERMQIPYYGEGVGTIKKFWTGSGNASKERMIAEADRRGFNPKDDNEADALALLHLTLHDWKELIG